MKKDVLVFVDNGFFKLVKREFERRMNKKLNFFQTFRNICNNQNVNLKHLFFYTAPPFQSQNATEEEINLRKNFDSFSNILKHKKWITLREGRCQRLKIDGNFEYSQKGVDSWIVFDLSRLKLNFPEIKKVILISSDSDFAPIIKEIQEKDGLEVILYTYFDKKRHSSFSLSNDLLNSVSKWIKFKDGDFEK